ncbi:MAG: Nif3-like dinuclear metal center hexameric protein [Oscillospiraceae bacterium]|nr:Nif3-like dinuclear metal center hexameric protein [Oscillospiraceae bacterium]
MNVRDVLDAVNEIAPFELAEPWDNTGLLLGSGDAPVTKVLTALDVTGPVADEAADIGAELIVTHHPIIYPSLKSISGGSVVYKLIRAGISVICAHTNLDKTGGGVNDTLVAVLGLADIRPLPGNDLVRLGELGKPLSPRGFAKLAAEKLSAPGARYNDPGKPIRTVAVCGGSGAEQLYALPGTADAFLTGESKHRIWLDAARLGICYIEAGHFHTENVIIPVLAKRLRGMLAGVEIAQSESCTDFTEILSLTNS